MSKKIFKILFLCVIVYLLAGQLFLPRETKRSEHDYKFLNDGWEWVKQDGSTEMIKAPGDYPVEQGKVMTIRRKLPDDIQDNYYFLYYCARQDVWIYIDRVLRNEYSTRDTRLLGKTSSPYYLFTELTKEDAGREIRVEFRTDSSYSGVIRDICYGDMISLNGRLLHSAGPELVMSVIVLMLGCLVVFFCVILKKNFGGYIPLEYLGWSVIVLGGWAVLNSVFRQFLFPNLSTASDATFLFIMLAPFPFLIYINDLQKGRFRNAYLVLEILVMAYAFSAVALVINGVWDFADTITLNVGACVLAIVLIVITVLADLFTGKIREYLFPAIGFLGLCVTGVLQCVLFINRNENLVSGILVAVGMIFLLAMAVITTVRELLQINNEKHLAIQSSETQAQFLASMSHEIRTPINAVLGMDEMILRESTQKEVLEYATDIQNAGKSLLAIINDILDFSKVQSGKMELVPVEYSLAGLIRDCSQMIDVRAKEKNLEYVVKNNPDLPAYLFGDEVRLRQIVINFLTNALKYTEQGTVTLVVDGRPGDSSASRDNWDLKISVRDTGIGLREEDLPHLFDAFARMDTMKNRNIEGTGLGLALSNNLAKLMGGSIDVESVYGEGTTFILNVPQQARGRETIGEFRTENARTRISAPRRTRLYAPDARILVVDDVAVNLKVFTSLLKNSGLTIDTAESGEECLSRVREWTYDIIFLDHMMPVMNGLEVMERIRHMEFGPNANTPVIMLTANAVLGAKEAYMEAGFSDYLTKPIQMEELEEMIDRYLKR